MQLLRMSLVFVLAFYILGGAAGAGEYYYSEDDNYWWYWDGEPPYKVLIPSNANATSYVETEWGGQTTLQVSLGEKGPVLLVGTLPETDPDEAWTALSAKWAAMADSARTTTSEEIETEMGLSADFRVLTAEMESGEEALVRMVAFRQGSRLAYLMFVGDASQYAGDARQYWLRAVHSFIWR